MASLIATLERRIADRLADLQAEIHADAGQAAAFEQAVAEIRRLCRDADDLYVGRHELPLVRPWPYLPG